MEGVSKHQGNDLSEIHLTEIGLKRILARNGVRLASSGRVEVETKGISIGVDLTTELRRQEDSLDLGALLGVDYWLQVKQEIFELFCQIVRNVRPFVHNCALPTEKVRQLSFP